MNNLTQAEVDEQKKLYDTWLNSMRVGKEHTAFGIWLACAKANEIENLKGWITTLKSSNLAKEKMYEDLLKDYIELQKDYKDWTKYEN